VLHSAENTPFLKQLRFTHLYMRHFTHSRSDSLYRLPRLTNMGSHFERQSAGARG
jgi:hypothetical protein